MINDPCITVAQDLAQAAHNLPVFDLSHGGAKWLEIIDQGLVYQDVTISQIQNSACCFCFPQSPDNLKSCVGFTRSGCHDQQNTFLAACYGFDCAVDGFDLVITWFFAGTVAVAGFHKYAFILVFHTTIGFVALPDVAGEMNKSQISPSLSFFFSLLSIKP